MGKLPDGVTSADASATHNVVYVISLQYDQASVKKIRCEGVTYPYIAKYGKPLEDTGSGYTRRLDIASSGSMINVFFTDRPLEIEVKNEERRNPQ